MSVTTSTNTVTNSVLPLLTDYELHHTDETTPHRTAPAPNTRDEASPENPEWWPTDHRRIPDYRPANRNLDRTQRPDGTNPIETWFIFTMLNGVNINANVSRLWKRTGGRINDRIFYYPIGGER